MMKRTATKLKVLAAGLACALSTLSHADEAAPIAGVARGRDGVALSNARLEFFQYGGPDHYYEGERATVTTDAAGHFSLALTDALMNGMASAPEPGKPGIPVLVVPFNLGAWQMQWLFAPPNQADEKELLRDLATPARSVWQKNGDAIELLVETPAPATLEVLVRAPGGAPLRNAPVILFQKAAEHGFSRAAIRLDGKTDSDGKFVVRRFAGLSRFQIFAPGTGFGGSGLIEALSGQTTRIELPPLAPLSSIEGKIAPELVGAASHVEADFSGRDDWDVQFWPSSRADVEADGHFILRDVVPGVLRVRAADLKDGKKSESKILWLAPGQTRRDVDLKEAPPEPQWLQQERQLAASPIQETPPTVTGTVRDADGQSVAGATVWALCSFDGGIRSYQRVLSGMSDARGQYEIKDLPRGVTVGSLIVIAQRDGLPPGEARAALPHSRAASWDRRDDGLGDLIRADIDLPTPAHAGSLAVRVLQNQKPAAAWVSLSGGNGPMLYDAEYVGAARGKDSEALQKILQPVQATDADGVAHFENLAPGLYAIHVTQRLPKDPQPQAYSNDFGDFDFQSDARRARNDAQSVSVQSGARGEYSMNIFDHAVPVAVRVLRPDGAPLRNEKIDLGGNRVTLDADGQTKFELSSGRAQTLSVDLERTQLQEPAAGDAPFWKGAATINVSQIISQRAPLVVQLHGVQPPALDVQLQDETGAPARGTIVMDDGDNVPLCAATTDEKGRAHFAGVAEYGMLRAYLNGRATPFSPAEILNGADNLALPGAEVHLQNGQRKSLTLRAEPVGFAVGRVLVPAGERGEDYFLELYPDKKFPARTVYDAATGNFSIGPLPFSKLTLRLKKIFKRDAQNPFGEYFLTEKRDVNVGEKVTPIELAPRARTREESWRLFPDEAFDRKQSASGTVFLSDGKTPALGARVQWFTPSNWRAAGADATDARGQFQVACNSSWLAPAPVPAPSGSPTIPVLVAWLPGDNGAVIVPLQSDDGDEYKNLKIVLPAPVALRGRVLLNGKSFASLPATVHVVASRLGNGKLNDALSLSVYCQSDGSFDLRGLTPGEYSVRAVVDEIWSSQPFRFSARAGASTPFLKFNVVTSHDDRQIK